MINPSDYICYSGGAIGSDIYWRDQGGKYGIRNRDYTIHDLSKLNANQLAEVEGEYLKALEILKRSFLPFDSLSGKLVRRDYLQAKAADAIFAIVEGFDSSGNVKGGTAYAVLHGINMKKPVYVFDQSTPIWSAASYTPYGAFMGFVATEEVPVLTKKFAGIGTRKINDIGRVAIGQVYKNAFGK